MIAAQALMHRPTPTTIDVIPAGEPAAVAPIVVGVVSHNNAETISHVLRTAEEGLRTHFGSQGSLLINVDAGSTDDTRARVAELRQDVTGLIEMPASDTVPVQPVQATSALAGDARAFRTLLEVARLRQARACLLLSPNLRSITPDWIERLLRPVLEEKCDFVLPWYARHRFEGTLTSGIVYPLTRALYGKRLRQPTGSEVAFSLPVADLFLRRGVWELDAPHMATDARAATEVMCAGGLRVCQAHVGPVAYASSAAAGDLSSVLADVLGSVFEEMIRNAAFWQRVRGSEPVPTFGRPGEPAPEPDAVDPHKALESFRLGCKNLQDVWAVLLPPGTLLELNRLARTDGDRFYVPDEMWARLVYDFALGYRLRSMNRGHLLRALTPLYLGWLASFMLEMRDAGCAEVEARLERLAAAYEGMKPYLISRWRWPDRFNP